MNKPEPLLEVINLTTRFATEQGTVTAVDGISFSIYAGETVGLVGESGCGKSVTSLSILKLFGTHSGTTLGGKILFGRQDLLALPADEIRKIRGNQISMIFQDPMTSLNPVYTVGDQIAESIMLHQHADRKTAMDKAVQMLELVGIPSPEKRVHEYPFQLSGGMRQRVMIAMGLACQPQLLIADEPTTALDVTIQAQILELMAALQKQLNMGIILITHDLGVVAEVCSRVMVMYLGQIVEECSVKTLFADPRHPYTVGLIRSIPLLDGDRKAPLHMIEGSVPSLRQIPPGCRFEPRCEHACDQCRTALPSLENVEDGHKVRCWLYQTVGLGGDAGAGNCEHAERAVS